MAEAPKAQPEPQRLVMESPGERVQREIAEAARLAAERDITNGPAGGRYLIGADAQGKGGTLVDAEGKPVKADKDE
jgi:sugar (pentulose or hexulose) kinase